ncbi:MAG: thiamine pyrophosphate-dependent enzyme [bacterium]
MAAPAAGKKVNRAVLIDEAFTEFVRSYEPSGPKLELEEAVLAGHTLTGEVLLELFESQIASRQIDLMARVKRLENKVFYTIGSSGHEGNTMVGRLTRHTDPAYLHYRSGGLVAERYRHIPGMSFVDETALSFAASSEDPSSGGRHKVWGSKPLWIIPQTSTIASHLPKAFGCAVAIAQSKHRKHELPVPDDSIVVCNFGDASANHSTAQGAFNSAQWTAHQGLNAPILFICEDNGWGISVKTPGDWIAQSFSNRHGLHYVAADGCDLAKGWDDVKHAVEYCRSKRKPVFLHLKTERLMGHAGTDFEVDYRKLQELEAAESRDPLLKTAARVMDAGLMTPDQVLALYEQYRVDCIDAADAAHIRPKLINFDQVKQPLAPVNRQAEKQEAERADFEVQRLAAYGSEKALPENQAEKHLAVNINRVLTEMLAKYPQALIFGEDVAQKGGVYTVTRGLQKKFGAARVFNSLLDEQTILGLAQGYSAMGYLPIPEIQYLAYYHNACDQIRGEACSLQFFSNNQYQNPLVMRVAGLGYQKGFGGHFHNDNSIAALRDIPGLTIACPSRGDDAVRVMRTLMAMGKVSGRVSMFLEPIALYMTKDLYENGDGLWQFKYPLQGDIAKQGEARIYHENAKDFLIITFGNAVPMALRVAKEMQQQGVSVKVMDLIWLQPLNRDAIQAEASSCRHVIVLDEGRESAGVGEGVITALCEQDKPPASIKRVCGEDCYTPLGDAAGLGLPNENKLRTVVHELLNQSQ